MKQCRCYFQKEIITIDTGSELGSGGEAKIYRVDIGSKTLAVKIYHNPPQEYFDKLSIMIKNPPQDPMADQGLISIAWPVDLLCQVDGKNRIIGFIMPCVEGMSPIFDFYNPKTRISQCPRFNYRYLHRTARNLSAVIHAIHNKGYVVGDINESNILVSERALVTLIDTDSFQIHDQEKNKTYRCPVGKPEFTPREIQNKKFDEIDRKKEHDLFGLAVLIFQLLMEGTHPFAGRYMGKGDPPPYDERIQSGHFPYCERHKVPYEPKRNAPPFTILSDRLRSLFIRCFEEGHRNPEARPDADEWKDALIEAENSLKHCKNNKHHLYGEHLNACPWCERTRFLQGLDPFPATIQKPAPKPAQRPSPQTSPPRQPAPRPVPKPPYKPFVYKPFVNWLLSKGIALLALLTLLISLGLSNANTLAFFAIILGIVAVFSTKKGGYKTISVLVVLIGIATLSISLERQKASNPGSLSEQVMQVKPEETAKLEETAETADRKVITVPSIAYKMVYIPPGKFTMGSPGSEKGRDDDERSHKVTLTKGFYIGATEVTQGQWEAIMGNNPSNFGNCGADCPVEEVSWDDCKEFIRRLNQKEGTDKYRLPTEAEWEYACRAGSQTAFANGDITETECGLDPLLDKMGWYCGNAGDTTHPVGKKSPNGWGLYDMHGNVWEWCEDWFGDYPSGDVADPRGLSVGSARVVRGGGWSSRARDCRSADRVRDAPGRRDFSLGLRLARTL